MALLNSFLCRCTPRQFCRSMCKFTSEAGDTPRMLLPNEVGGASALFSEKLEKKKASMSTLLSHAGLSMNNKNDNQNQPLSPPIELATTYERPPCGNYGDGWIYSRQNNPTRKLLEDMMGQLETTSSENILVHDEPAQGFAFSSGMAAIASLILAHKSPVKVLIPTDVYHGLPTQLVTVLNEHGVCHQAVDMTCNELHDIIKNAQSNEKNELSLVIWMETPSNPLCRITDMKDICTMVHEIHSSDDALRITTVVDSTWAPPCITQPIKLGADVVVHSGTKYLGGHSDVLLGMVCTSPFTTQGKILSERLRAVQSSIGAVASPFDCWLTLRGLRTLHLRVERSSRSALELAKYLETHSNVLKCHYPGLASHPQHKIATQQMTGYGGMLSFEVRDETMAMAVAGAVRTIKRATSLGGTESLIEHRASIEPPERRTSPPGLLRLSVGLEDVNDLKSDLERALKVATMICNHEVD